jgi:electron transport complex protein RnfG
MKKRMKSTIVFLIFVLVSVVLIGLTYTVTAGPLEIQRGELGGGAIRELLPGTHRTESVDLEEDSTLSHLVRSYDSGDEFIGYVFTAVSSGFAGDIEMMVALNPQGVIEGLQVIAHSETVGIGDGIGEEWFAEMFVGRSGMLFSSSNATNPQEIDAIAGATISTDAIIRGVNDASAYVSGEEVPIDMGQVAEAVPGIDATMFWPEVDHTQRIDMEIIYDAAGEVSGYIFYVSPEGYSRIDMAVAIDSGGVIVGVQILQHNETWNFGALVLDDEDFLEQFVGRSQTMIATRDAQGPGEIDAVTMATLTVDAVLEGINGSIEFFNSLQQP